MPFKWFRNRYRCFYCDEIFLDCSKLKEHTKTHDEIKVNRLLKKIGCHSRIKWDISEISCKLCPKPIQSFDHYLNHLSEAHDLKIDRNVFDRSWYIFSLSEDGMFCIECCESFKFFAPLLRHVNKYHNNSKKYVCDYCGLAFALKGTITHHIRNVHSGITTTCKLCGVKFPSKASLSNHCRKSHKTGKFVCDLCPETFESRYLRRNHIALDHNDKSLQFPCEKCSKIFTRKSTLLKHVSVVHLKEKFTTCHLCGHKGYDLQALRRHMNTHDPAKNFKCPHCGQKFKMRKTFAAHISKHREAEEQYILG